MDKFTLETSLQFPAFRLTELVSYSIVRKPSGVAYIVLVLIRDSKQRTMRMADALVNFGVPERLHHIFKDAIIDLIRQGLITSDFGESISASAFSSGRISLKNGTNLSSSFSDVPDAVQSIFRVLFSSVRLMTVLVLVCI